MPASQAQTQDAMELGEKLTAARAVLGLVLIPVSLVKAVFDRHLDRAIAGTTFGLSIHRYHTPDWEKLPVGLGFSCWVSFKLTKEKLQ